MMKKILIGYLIDGKRSGIDNYILNVVGQIKKDDIQIDCLTNRIDRDLKNRLDKMGVGLIEIPTLKHPFRQYQAMNQIIRKGKYEVAYFNISEAFNSIGVLAAHNCGVKKVVVHSHSSGVNEHSKVIRAIRTFCHTIMKNLVLRSCVSDYYACSKKAGEWLFPKKVIGSSHFHVMNNAIQTERFQYNPEIRIKKRKELGLENRIVIGQIGAFSYQKNSEYVVKIAKELHRKNPDAIVLMIGSGKDYDQIAHNVKEQHLEEAVSLMGIRMDVNELVQAMDLFILPSRFEGLPIVAIEAQISGLKVILSDTISEEAALSDRCMFHSIECPANEWADMILENLQYDRNSLDLSNCGYCFDIQKQNEQIQQIFEL